MYTALWHAFLCKVTRISRAPLRFPGARLTIAFNLNENERLIALAKACMTEEVNYIVFFCSCLS